MRSLVFVLTLHLSGGLAVAHSRDYKAELREFNSSRCTSIHGPIEFQLETIYYPPVFVEHTVPYVRPKRISDPTFRGKPRSRQEVWFRNFNTGTLNSNFEQIRTLMRLLNSVILQYMNACTPVILYDHYVENQEGDLLKRLFQDFPTTYIHGKINQNYTLDHPELLNPPDSKCRSYILFLADALKTRQVIGPQIDNKVIVVPRSTQWKLQEFLTSPLSRDIINLLVIGESYSSDQTKIQPYVLYTHKLYTDGLGSNQPILLTSWMRDKFTRPQVNLFPTKFSAGFAGHRFSVVAANQPPYVFKRVSLDGVGNINIKWDGLEIRVLRALAKMMNFTINIVEPKNTYLGSGDAVADMMLKKQGDIGLAGMYVTSDRNYGMAMSVAHTTDCAAFISLTSKALPRFRAIMGPFQWPVWLCLTSIYLLAIFPLAFSDQLSLRHLIGNYTEIENMFWYVFGTFTNSLTFSGQYSWSTSKKTSTRLLIGWYWIFTIIITACYTGSIIAFVTIPVFPDTVDTVDQLLRGLFRVGTLGKRVCVYQELGKEICIFKIVAAGNGGSSTRHTSPPRSS
jgi:Ligand-gated ion channel